MHRISEIKRKADLPRFKWLLTLRSQTWWFGLHTEAVRLKQFRQSWQLEYARRAEPSVQLALEYLKYVLAFSEFSFNRQEAQVFQRKVNRDILVCVRIREGANDASDCYAACAEINRLLGQGQLAVTGQVNVMWRLWPYDSMFIFQFKIAVLEFFRNRLQKT